MLVLAVRTSLVHNQLAGLRLLLLLMVQAGLMVLMALKHESVCELVVSHTWWLLDTIHYSDCS